MLALLDIMVSMLALLATIVSVLALPGSAGAFSLSGVLVDSVSVVFDLVSIPSGVITSVGKSVDFPFTPVGKRGDEAWWSDLSVGRVEGKASLASVTVVEVLFFGNVSAESLANAS